MSGVLVVSGSDLSMSDLDGGAISGRIDLNLNLAPSWSPDFLGLGSGYGDDLRVVDSHEHLSRRILPRFGPGIHGVFLDLHHDLDPQADQSAYALARGISPALSFGQPLPSIHSVQTQTLNPRHSLPARSFSQETVEQLHEGLYDQMDAAIAFPFVQESPENRPLWQIQHGFRRYMRPVTAIGDENLEFQPMRLEEAVELGPSLAESMNDDETKEGSCNGEREGEASNAANFECNVCLDMAVEPVLTCCGHLFCWPCLYRWLYLHSEDQECPVCKGAVTESDIIPIYGRGSKITSVGQLEADESDYVPPRPHALRTESSRQRLGGWIRGWEWERDRMGEVEREDPSEFMWRSNEILTMRRAFHFLQGNLEGRLHTGVRTRRRMAERRERSRAPAVEAASNVHLHHAVGSLHESLQQRVARLSEHLQEDVRRFTINRTQTDDRLALIRARITNLAGNEDPQRTVSAAISVSGQDGLVIPSVTSHYISSQIVHSPSGTLIPEEAESLQGVDIIRQANEGTRDQWERLGMFVTQTGEAHSSRSGYADMEAESSHGRKRRRLN